MKLPSPIHRIDRAFVRTFVVPLLALATVWPGAAAAQLGQVPDPSAYALQNVTVIHADGREQSGVNIVVRDGMIEAIGAGAAIPGDAEVLEGSGLHVYPGFVDAWGEVEVAFPDVDREEQLSWDPTRAQSGFQPHLRVADWVAADGEGVADQRRAGLVALAHHPTTGLAGGRSALLLLRKSARRPVDLVLNPELGLTLTFRSGRGAYPSTIFGVFTYHRQAFLDAEHAVLEQAAYAADPRGLPAPAWDPDDRVLVSAATGELPVFFEADGAEDIRNVFKLADEFRFRPVILGGEEAWKVADELARRDIPVLLSADLPEPDDWDPRASGEPNDPGAAREKMQLEEAWSNAAKLEDAGVRFLVTTGGGDGDLREGLRRMVEYGLSEGAALRAITSGPAEFLGIPQLPRIAAGQAATFTVLDGELLSDDASVAYTFVEGELERPGEGRSGNAGGRGRRGGGPGR